MAEGDRMSRFSNLEFDKNSKIEKSSSLGEPIRDKHYFYNRAVSAWLSAKFEDALQNYSRSLEDDSTYYEGWFGQIKMLIELSEYPEAIIWSDKALEMFPQHHEILAAKSVATLREGNMQKAQELSDKAISKEKTTYYVLLARSELLLAQKSRAAETCIHHALNISGNNLPIVYLEAGRILLRNGEYGSAISLLSDAVKQLPESALAWYELGCCQTALGFSEAKQTLSHCLRLSPNWAEAKAALRDSEKRSIFSWFRRKH